MLKDRWFVACSFPDDFGVVHTERARQEQQSIFQTGVAGTNVVLPFLGGRFPLVVSVVGVSSVFVCLLVSYLFFLFLLF